MDQVSDNQDNNPKRSILVVEDNELNREMLCALIGDEFQVYEAKDGLDGLHQLEERYKDLALVLLDVYMPVCDGFEFLQRKKEDSRYDTIPVIVTTMSGLVEDERRCLELGANDFIVKPYDREVISNRINNLIRLRESASIANLLRRDPISGFCSKEYFHRVVEDTFGAHPDADYDMVCSDIDRFKELNDRYGEENCDQLLRQLAQRLTEALPGLIVAGRVGGDSYAFLLEHQERGWEECLHAVIEGLPFPNLSMKFGVSENVDKSMPVPIICNQCITALNTVKGRLGVEMAWYNEEMRQRQIVEQIIHATMGEALDGHQFFVQYQPKHDVRAGKAGGAEALVRWNHPELGLVNPGVFITLFERNGFIAKLDLFVWEEACKEIRRCQDMGLPPIPISVNVSRLDFDNPDLPKRIEELADKYDIDRSLLHIELTETAYSDSPETVKAMLDELRDMGFPTELDDFGAGYSSIVSLNVLPLDVMKLDMSMIRQATELNDYRIVESTINMARTLGMKTVVEGVETAEEARRVTEMGCDYIQGYYYSRPLPQDEFEDYLKSEGE